MAGKITPLLEVLAADLADEGSLVSVQSDMGGEPRPLLEGLSADLAVEVSLMNPDMCGEMGLQGRCNLETIL